ncbi:unnamed protein product [Brassicogethes aeneus]|uniref:Uncharacterized protein n=1 Tax=Brassicogethes aeneus TaxID=1431903 RepID=A0A9P0AYN1_BRAAE|nr:unnamed protein product [Brassicogethes aeneus]
MSESDKILCAYCKTGAVKKIASCTSCKAIFHKSCGERYVCCSKKNTKGHNEDQETEEESNEAMLLKRKNSELEINNKVLQEKLILVENLNSQLQEQIIKLTMASNKENFITRSEFEKEINNIKDLLKKDKNTAKAESKTFSKAVRDNLPAPGPGTSDENKLLQLEDKQRKIMSEVISLTASNESNNQDWQIKKSKTKKEDKKMTNTREKTKPIIGSSNSNLLTSVPRLSHVYVGRLQPDTKEEQVIEFLKQSCPAVSKVSCEKLKSKLPDVYSSFKISIQSNVVDKIKDPSIWPAGVLINTFFMKRREEPPKS